MNSKTIVCNIKCNECNTILPPHTMAEHLNVDSPVLQCPHREENEELWDKWEAVNEENVELKEDKQTLFWELEYARQKLLDNNIEGWNLNSKGEDWTLEEE